MQSKNVLWLGLLFLTLLTVFCIAKYIDRFNPELKTVSNPIPDINTTKHELDKNISELDMLVKKKLQQKEIAKIDKHKVEKKSGQTDHNSTQPHPKNKNIDVDENYINIMDVVSKEEEELQKNYNQLNKQKRDKPSKNIVKKDQNSNHEIIKKKTLVINSVIDKYSFTNKNVFTRYEQNLLKKLYHKYKNNHKSRFIIKSPKEYKKLHKIKKFIISLGVKSKDITTSKKSINNNKKIVISVIKRIEK